MDAILRELQWIFQRFILPGSSVAMVGLHFAEWFVSPPPSLPDIFPVLWILVGCVSFFIMWIASLGALASFLVKSTAKVD
jgi:hypothetical protein